VPYHAIEDPKQLQALLDAALLVESDLDLPAILQHVLGAATSLTGARYGALGVLDRSGQGLADFHTIGADPGFCQGRLPEGKGVLGLLITDPRPLRLEELTTHPRSVGFPPGHPPMHSFLGVPIRVRGEVFGNLYLADKEAGDQFTLADEQLVMSVAVAAGMAIHNARLVDRLAELSRLEDRERIARDLHDTVIQRLFATGLRLQGLAGMFQVPEVARRVQMAIDDLDETIREIRTTIFALSTSGDSLRGRITSVVEEAAGSLGFRPEVHLDGPLDSTVPGHVGDHLTAALREALANVGRHARARSVKVLVAVRDASELVLEVTDDGLGISDQGERKGLGLANMASRARSLGGTMAVAPGDGGGTVLTWSVPLNRDRAEA